MQIANQWLEKAKDVICEKVFKNTNLAREVHISYGFPSKRAMSESRKVVGQAWQTEEGVQAVFISPTQFEAGNYVEVLGILVHELIHIKIGVDFGHKGPFKAEMREVGLVGKATATEVGVELGQTLESLKADIGEIPEAVLTATKKIKKQTTRMKKMVCGCDSPRILRVSQKVLREGPIKCGVCDSLFKQLEESEGGGGR